MGIKQSAWHLLCALPESCVYVLQQSQAWGTHAGSLGCLHQPHSLSNPMQWRKMMKWDKGTTIGSSSPALLDRKGNSLVKQTAGKAWMATCFNLPPNVVPDSATVTLVCRGFYGGWFGWWLCSQQRNSAKPGRRAQQQKRHTRIRNCVWNTSPTSFPQGNYSLPIHTRPTC